MSKSFISTNQELRIGDRLISNNGNYKAVFQEDGKFVLYKWTPVWSTDTDKEAHRLILQSDGNLVMYNKKNNPVWASDTCRGGSNHLQMRLTLTNQGHLVVEDDAKECWKSKTREVE